MFLVRSIVIATLVTCFFSAAQGEAKESQLNPSKAADAVNKLAFDLYKLNSKNGENLFFSPISIEIALAMTAGGAANETLAQMTKALYLFPDSHAAFAELIKSLKVDKDYQLLIANRLWAAKNTEYKSTFLNLLLSSYGAALVPLDFKTETERSRLTINKWVEGETKNKIVNLLNSGDIASDTEMVLVNAIYFLGHWQQPFEKKLTAEGKFHLSKAKTAKVPFMKTIDQFEYSKNSDFELLELPYVNGELAMDIVLPQSHIGLEAAEKKLTPNGLKELLETTRKINVQATIPKFKMESRLKLGSSLKKLGITDAFDNGKADFEGIRKVTKDKNLSISEVIHQAVCEVNEEGTEAAAATAVTMFGGSAPAQPTIFKVDRPFLFLIRHLKSGAILFMGRYSKP